MALTVLGTQKSFASSYTGITLTIPPKTQAIMALLNVDHSERAANLSIGGLPLTRRVHAFSNAYGVDAYTLESLSGISGSALAWSGGHPYNSGYALSVVYIGGGTAAFHEASAHGIGNPVTREHSAPGIGNLVAVAHAFSYSGSRTQISGQTGIITNQANSASGYKVGAVGQAVTVGIGSLSVAGTVATLSMYGTPGPLIDVETAPASQGFADATWTHAPGQQAKALLTFYARTGSKEPDGSQTYGGLDVPIVSDGYQASWDEADGYSDVRAKVGLDGRTGDAIVHAGSAGGNNVYALTLRHEKDLKIVDSAVHAGDGEDQTWGAVLDPQGHDSLAYIFTNNNTEGVVTPVQINGRSAVQKWILDTSGKRISLYVHELKASEGPQFIGAVISSAVKAVTHVGVVGASNRKRNQALLIR
jgi:hypothetical protein